MRDKVGARNPKSTLDYVLQVRNLEARQRAPRKRSATGITSTGFTRDFAELAGRFASVAERKLNKRRVSAPATDFLIVKDRELATMVRYSQPSMPRKGEFIPIRDRFWALVEKHAPDSCWLWKGHKNRNGYGKFKLSFKPNVIRTAHRLAWEWTYGPILDGLFVLHSCNNVACVNPAHLFLGMSSDVREPKPKTELSVTISKFWERVDKSSSSCWIWQGTCGQTGYGRMALDGIRKSAHRFAWEVTNGEIPKGLSILHKCDNPPCVNPNHLFLGTQQDNVLDMMQKGRHAHIVNDKDKYQILQAHSRGEAMADIARRFGISKRYASAIVGQTLPMVRRPSFIPKVIRCTADECGKPKYRESERQQGRFYRPNLHNWCKCD